MHFFFFLLCIVFFFSVCPQIAFAATIIKDINVNPTQPWIDSGLDVNTGSSLTIQNTIGKVYIATSDSTGVFVTGLSGCTAGATFLLPGATCYSLLARIGQSSPFQVNWSPMPTGGLFSTINPSAAGRVYFSVNDEIGLFADNSGGWPLHLIYSYTPPPPRPPLIFIPGIGGSELKTTNEVDWSKDDGHGGTFTYTYPAGETVWVNNGQAALPGDDDYFDVLRMKSDGTTSEANLDLTGNVFARAYQGTIDFFTNNGYTLNQDFFVFPYDWRKDLSLTASLLDQKIEAVKQQTSSQKVDIVAHSMGGLVARNYIADTSRAQKVRKLVTLGTPHLGSIKFLKALNYGDCLVLPAGPFCLALAPSEVKDVLQNMIAGFELSPSQTYYNFYTNVDPQHPFPFKDDRDMDSNGVTGALSYSQTKTLYTNLGHNTGLFTPSETFHTIDSNLANTNGVDVTLIAGSGMATLGQIVEKYAVDLLGIQITKKDEVMINGDDTVPLFSASLKDPDQNHSLLGSAKLYYTHQKHGDLVASGSALLLAKNILDSNTQLPAGVSQQPYSFNGVGVSVHSPVNIHAYDASGNHTGPTPDGFEENIPESSYDTLGDSKFIFLPQDGQYSIRFEATDQGSFDFKIRKFESDTNTETILYNAVPLTANTKAETTLDTQLPLPPQPPILEIDTDGNGSTDTSVNASVVLTGNAAADQTPPISSYSLNSNPQNGWFKNDVVVTLSANDEASGSGVAKTDYAIDNGNYQPYTTAFSINKEDTTNLKIKSTDAAGNQEYPQSLDIKIDKTAPEPKASFNLQNQAIEVIGTDNLSTVTVSENPVGLINLTDAAGNSTKLTVSPTTVPRKTKIIFLTIQYNNNNQISLPTNELDTTLRVNNKTNQVSSFTQKETIPGQTLSSSYDTKTNTTTIIIGQKKQAQTITKPGMIFLQLLTSNGQLQTQY